jgi:hypothetical protein
MPEIYAYYGKCYGTTQGASGYADGVKAIDNHLFLHQVVHVPLCHAFNIVPSP